MDLNMPKASILAEETDCGMKVLVRAKSNSNLFNRLDTKVVRSDLEPRLRVMAYRARVTISAREGVAL